MGALVEKLIVYGAPRCPGVPPVKAMLERVGVDYEYVNILRDPEARERVREINQGYESVPTLLFADGSTLTEPSAGELQKKLKALGYQIPLSAIIAGNAWAIFIGIAVLIALMRAFGLF